MNIEDIKVGETYNVRVKVIEKYGDCVDAIYAEYDAIEGIHIPKRRIGILRPISPENGIKNTETAPKYDQNRLFRNGDKVKAVLRHGRIPNDGVPKDVILEVIADERDGIVKVLLKMGAILEIFKVYALYLELVTPVEELEPYSVVDAHTHWDVADKNMKTVAMYSKGNHPNAKEAAEAERDRLNAEYRKEQE